MSQTCVFTALVGRAAATGGRLALFTLLATACAFAQTQTPSSKSTKTAAAEPVEPDGLHIAYDASESMCGFFGAEDPDRVFGGILDLLAAQGTEAFKVRKMLIREHKINQIESAKSDFHLNRRPGNCSPFDGAASNPEIIFDAKASKSPARSLLLVSDMQLSGDSRDRFIAEFERWYVRQHDIDAVRAGILTLAVPFKGKYFPIPNSSQDGARPAQKVAPLSLPQHERPLSLLWFAANKEDADHVKTLLSNVRKQVGAARVLAELQFAPITRTASARWFTAATRPDTARDIFEIPTLQVAAEGSPRLKHLERCAGNPRFVGDELHFELLSTCRDQSPFFGGKNETIVLTLPLKPDLDYTIEVAPDKARTVAVGNDGRNVTLRLNSAPPKSLVLPIALAAADDGVGVASFDAISLKDENCDVSTKPKTAPDTQCVDRFNRRTFQYGALVSGLADRARAIRKQRGGTESNEAQLALTIVVESGRTH